jgi:hypothetical protein
MGSGARSRVDGGLPFGLRDSRVSDGEYTTGILRRGGRCWQGMLTAGGLVCEVRWSRGNPCRTIREHGRGGIDLLKKLEFDRRLGGYHELGFYFDSENGWPEIEFPCALIPKVNGVRSEMDIGGGEGNRCRLIGEYEEHTFYAYDCNASLGSGKDWSKSSYSKRLAFLTGLDWVPEKVERLRVLNCRDMDHAVRLRDKCIDGGYIGALIRNWG